LKDLGGKPGKAVGVVEYQQNGGGGHRGVRHFVAQKSTCDRQIFLLKEKLENKGGGIMKTWSGTEGNNLRIVGLKAIAVQKRGLLRMVA